MKRALLILIASALCAASIEDLVRQVASWDYGKDVTDVRELETVTLHTAGTPGAPALERQLLVGLASAKSLAAKDAFCRDLSYIGSDAAVPTLTELLAHPDTAPMARYALARIQPESVSRSTPPPNPTPSRPADLRELARNHPSAAIAALPNATERERAIILTALADFNAPGARKTLLSALEDQSAGVRISALDGLAKRGTAADVERIAARAAASTADEQSAAREALAAMRDEGVDAAILDLIPHAEPKVKLELIRAMGERGVPSGAPVLLSAAASGDRSVRIESIRALRETAGPGDAPALLALLLKSPNDAERRELERALAGALRRLKDGQIPGIADAYRDIADDQIRISLLNVLSLAGAPAGLPLVREALNAQSADIQRAALNALAGWPTPESMPDLLTLARNSTDPARKILALRGYIKVAQIPGGRPPAEIAKALGEAMPLASRPDEKRAVLAALQKVVCPESLAIARGSLSDAQVAAEAKLAVNTLERLLAFVGK